jgi:subtilisin family serine protease
MIKKLQHPKLWIVSTLLLIVSSCTEEPDLSNTEQDIAPTTRAQSGQKKFYYSFDKKIYLDEVEDKIVLTFEKENRAGIKEYIEKNARIRYDDSQTNNDYCVLTTTDRSEKKALMENLSKLSGIKSVNPLYVLSGDGLEIIVKNEVAIQFKNGVSQQQIDEVCKKFDITNVRNRRRFQIFSVPLKLDPLEIANAIQESGLANFSCPNFVSKAELLQTLPSDPYFVNQYYLRNFGQPVNGRTTTSRADINVVNAWTITKGSGDIVIAVIDTGATSDHPDLPNSRQVRLPGSNFADGDPNDPSSTRNNAHGDNCAGIIAASHNGEGIAGIAPNCKIMPIRVIRSTGSFVEDELRAEAITFAKDNGADIISISWGTITINPNYSTRIKDAIADAVTAGRDGKGCVVVISAGNEADQAHGNQGFVCFPSNVDIPGVLTVGASDRNDRQANYSATSNTNSPNNQIIDIVAPSHKAYSNQIPGETWDVWSIDIPGPAGQNPPPATDRGGLLPIPGTYLPSSGANFDAYTGHIGGTSAACPQVAGVAALLLSANPDMTQMEVFETICSTARKAGGYNYRAASGMTYGTWDPNMGYGVVDAYEALLSCLPGYDREVILTMQSGGSIGDQCLVFPEMNYVLNASVEHPGYSGGYSEFFIYPLDGGTVTTLTPPHASNICSVIFHGANKTFQLQVKMNSPSGSYLPSLYKTVTFKTKNQTIILPSP